MSIIDPPKRYAYLVGLGVLTAPFGIAIGSWFGGIIWSFIFVTIGIAGDADYVNENLDVNVRRWKWAVAALITSVLTGIFYLYRRRAWFKAGSDPSG